MQNHSNCLILVNGFGSTPTAELYLMLNSAVEAATLAGLHPSRLLAGSYATSLDMSGCSITVTLIDEEISQLWDAPVETAALSW